MNDFIERKKGPGIAKMNCEDELRCIRCNSDSKKKEKDKGKMDGQNYRQLSAPYLRAAIFQSAHGPE